MTKTLEETRARQRDYYRKEVQKAGGWRNFKIKQRYGITIEDYNRMLKEQQEVCKICGKKSKGNKPLYIDHDHTTGKVRGLLCFNCNSLLGLAYDDTSILATAITYLEREKGRK